MASRPLLTAPKEWNGMVLKKSKSFQSPELDSFDEAILALERDWQNYRSEDGWTVHESHAGQLENGKFGAECVYTIYVKKQ